MPTLPADASFIDDSVSEAQFKAAQAQMLQFLRSLLGSSGLAIDARTLLGLAGQVINYNNRGNWVTVTAYAVNDLVMSSGIVYVCQVAHTSGTFATDLAAGKWTIHQGLTAATLIATTGAGLSGFDPALTYPASTVGLVLKQLSSEMIVASAADLYSANISSYTALRILPGTYVVTPDLDLSAYELNFVKGGVLSVAAGKTLTIGPVRAGSYPIFAGAGAVVATRKTREVYPEWFGAPGGNGVDNSAGIAAAHAACLTNKVLVRMTDKYGIGSKLTWSVTVPIFAEMGSTWESFGGNVNCVDLSDGNNYGRSVFPLISGFSGYGMKLLGTNVANIFVPEIASCGDGLVLETVAGSYADLLDTKVEVHQIGLCTRGIVFKADATGNVMQGNEIRCNFISQTHHCIEFDNNGLGTSPNWDSNSIVLQATDPTTADTSSRVLYNPNSYAISRLSLRVESWCGGMNAAAKFIDGKFNDLDLYLNLAQAPVDGQMAINGTQNRIDVSIADGRADASVACATATNSKASYNGGVPSYRNRCKLQAVPATDWTTGTARTFYFYHVLTDGNSNRMRVMPPENAQGKVILPLRIFDNSLTIANEIQVTFWNLSGATITAGTVCEFIAEVGV